MWAGICDVCSCWDCALEYLENSRKEDVKVKRGFVPAVQGMFFKEISQIFFE
jgi:hypothetical protein